MFTLDAIRTQMEVQLNEDKNLHVVEVNADTLDEALADAAVQLDTKVTNIEYEVLERGSNGFLGISKKPWTIRAFPNAVAIAQKKKRESSSVTVEEALVEEEKIIDQDGIFYVRHFNSQICLKVVLPVGNGKPVVYGDVMAQLKRSDTLDIEEDSVKEFV